MTKAISIGNRLRAERERREMSIDEISQTTRIPRGALQHLEADRYDALPGDVFVRGYLRAYASIVGLDPGTVIEDFESERPSKPPGLRVSRVSPRRTPFGWRVAFATAMLFAVLVVAFALIGRPPAPQDPIELSESSPCLREQSKQKRCFFVRSTTETPTAS